MKVDGALKFFVFVVVCGVAFIVGGVFAGINPVMTGVIWFCGFVLAIILASSFRMVAQWQRAVVLSLGKFAGIRGPGLFFLIPLIETVSSVLDLRTITSTFRAEQTITADTVPVDVDAGTLLESDRPRARRARRWPPTTRLSGGRRKPRCAMSSAARPWPISFPVAKKSTPCCAILSIRAPTRGACRSRAWKFAM